MATEEACYDIFNFTGEETIIAFHAYIFHDNKYWPIILS